MKSNEKGRRINLRLAPQASRAIEQLRYEGKGKISCNAWVVAAIEEKIQRDSVREAAPSYKGDAKTFYEFFAGGGMARHGLGGGWHCLFANDFDPKKARVYRDNWHGGKDLIVEDINKIEAGHLPGIADLVWASFPCQDLSLAGKYQGIGRFGDKAQTRSGTFWQFWRLVNSLVAERRAPKVVVLENVSGILTSNDGKDFGAIGAALSDSGYVFGALVIDARLFVPQSRPRVFIVGVRSELSIDRELLSHQPLSPWHTDALVAAHSSMAAQTKKSWVWWKLDAPPMRRTRFADLIEESPESVKWHTEAETRRLLAMMSPQNLKKVRQAKLLGSRVVGGVYKRTRINDSGVKVQRAEVRFDEVAGCLRTPSGGSSRQLILVVEGQAVRSRLLSSREAARLMGLPDSYNLPKNYNEAYHLAGDGVVVPVVRYLAERVLEPILDGNMPQKVLQFKVA